MTTKKHLVVVHGMGTHTEESLKKEVSDTLEQALRSYESRKTDKIEDLVTIIPAVYDMVFDDFREARAKSGDTLLKFLEGINGFHSFPLSVANEIGQVEADLGKDKFFNTHWLDVILYRLTTLNERIRLQVAQKIADSVRAVGGANVHVLAHSLGTAVAHDALAKAFGPDNAVTADGVAVNLNPVTHRLGGVHMVANVSRALQTFVKAGSSIVRPGPQGCVNTFFEYRHKLDPIPRIRPFNPTNNGGWVTHDVFAADYALVEPSAVTRANVHDLGHYLAIPAVHQVLFDLVIGFTPQKAEREAAEKKFFATTVQGKAQALQAAFSTVGTDANDGAFRDLLDAWRQLRDLVESFGEKF